MRRAVLLLIFMLLWRYVDAQTIRVVQSGRKTGIRGLSVVDNSVVWISGSNGYVAVTNNAGKTWNWKQIQGYEKLDFRDIEAFSEKEAVIVSAGSPAVILKTQDGGQNWKEVYRNESADIFLDGMDFWSHERGIIFGDPINGHMQLLQTLDVGNSWKDISKQLNIPLQQGEAGFAASGTSIRTGKNGRVWIATGGSRSRIFHSKNFGKSWRAVDCPIIQGANSTGPFSIAFINNHTGLAVGGDYQRDTLRDNNLVMTRNNGRSWQKPASEPRGYRSAIEYLSPKILVATGTSGTDISYDGGNSWKNISTESYNAVRKAKKGNLVILAGANGRISILNL